MARKRKKKRRIAAKRARQKLQRPAQRLEMARQALRGGELSRAVDLSTAALAAANDSNTIASARQVAAEAYFRTAANSVNPEQRLHYLDKALAVVADEATLNVVKIHYHRGVTLLRLGRAQNALAEFEIVAAQQPERSGLNTMHQLARLVSGQPWQREGLPPEDEDWLQLLDGVIHGEDPDQLMEQLPMMMIPDEIQGLLRLLIQMYTNPSSAPVARLTAAVDQVAPLTSSPILPYYLGVAAARKGDAEAARAAWRRAADGGLATSWFTDNWAALGRAKAVELAQSGQWAAVLDLAESDRLSGLDDKILDETIGLAHFHLGYEAATAKQWATAVRHLRLASDTVSDRRLSQNLALAEEALGEWIPAAEAWRDLARRRPRKQDHPDYLSDVQVSAIWTHAADAYLEADWADDAITCMKHAVKYAADDDLKLRVQLVDVYMYDDRTEAAMNELDRVLAVDPEHVPALLRLGALYEREWELDPEPIWQRVLAVDPTNEQARELLAKNYLEQVNETGTHGWTGRILKRPEKEKIALLHKALEAVPNHPLLLSEMGRLHRKIKKHKQARDYLREAWAAAPEDVKVVGTVLHELLHAKGGDVVKELLPQVRQIPGLLAPFWVSQGKKALGCELGEEWATLFWDEALSLAEEGRGQDSVALILLLIFDHAYELSEPELAERYEARIEEEVPNSGAVEYVAGAYALNEPPQNRSKATQLFRKAQRLARKAHEPGVEQLASLAEAMASGRINPFLDILKGEGLLDILASLDEEEFDDFRSFL